MQSVHRVPLPMMSHPLTFGIIVPNRLFVGGLSNNTTEEELHALFSQYGIVQATKIITDRSGISKGYGFVTFETEEESLRMHKKSDTLYLNGKKLNIAPAIKKQAFPRASEERPQQEPPPQDTPIYYNSYSRLSAGGTLMVNPFPCDYHNGIAYYTHQVIPNRNQQVMPPINFSTPQFYSHSVIPQYPPQPAGGPYCYATSFDPFAAAANPSPTHFKQHAFTSCNASLVEGTSNAKGSMNQNFYPVTIKNDFTKPDNLQTVSPQVSPMEQSRERSSQEQLPGIQQIHNLPPYVSQTCYTSQDSPKSFVPNAESSINQRTPTLPNKVSSTTYVNKPQVVPGNNPLMEIPKECNAQQQYFSSIPKNYPYSSYDMPTYSTCQDARFSFVPSTGPSMDQMFTSFPIKNNFTEDKNFESFPFQPSFMDVPSERKVQQNFSGINVNHGLPSFGPQTYHGCQGSPISFVPSAVRLTDQLIPSFPIQKNPAFNNGQMFLSRDPLMEPPRVHNAQQNVSNNPLNNSYPPFTLQRNPNHQDSPFIFVPSTEGPLDQSYGPFPSKENSIDTNDYQRDPLEAAKECNT